MASIHETAEGLHDAGVMDKQTMRKFDEACLTPVRPLTAAEIRALREREGASQAVFARYLNVTAGLSASGSAGRSIRRGRRSSCFPLSPGTGWGRSHNWCAE